MKLYNTLTRSVDTLTPLRADNVKLYTCGLTVYNQPHIGNWLPYIYWDILVRALRAEGNSVEHTQNITDVGHMTSDDDTGEDKMEKGAKREGITAWDIAAKYIDIATREAAQLGLLQPTHLVRATDTIPQQIAFAEGLDKKGYLYEISGDGMYFDTSKLVNYGALAKLDVAGLAAGARVSVAGKKNITDFAVWKFSPKGTKRDMEWWAPWNNGTDESGETHPVGTPRTSHSNTPQDGEQRAKPYNTYGYGEGVAESSAQQHAESAGGLTSSAEQQNGAVSGSWGFPGWHLECSVIARETLGDTIDIHAGGIDHIPVHHTNEIAQTEAITGKTFSQFWIHCNHLKVEGGKMAKSKGNVYTLADITAKGYPVAAFKLFALGKHYRTEGNFTWENLEAAANRLRNWQEAADLRHQITHQSNEANDAPAFRAKLIALLANDLDTVAALQFIDKTLETVREKHASDEPLEAILEIIAAILGIDLRKAAIPQTVQAIIEDRNQARAAKDWARSDELRDTLAEQGIGLRDTPNGAIWYRL